MIKTNFLKSCIFKTNKIIWVLQKGKHISLIPCSFLGNSIFWSYFLWQVTWLSGEQKKALHPKHWSCSAPITCPAFIQSNLCFHAYWNFNLVIRFFYVNFLFCYFFKCFFKNGHKENWMFVWSLKKIDTLS